VELTKRIPDYGGLLRILCDARFKTPKGWTEARYTIMDTGAYTSLLPLSLWKKLETEILADYFVRGLVPKTECKIDVKVGWVTAIILDKEGNATPEIKFRAFLALIDNILLIIGFKDLLEKYHLEIDVMANEAFIEAKNNAIDEIS